jgi:CheY-like chemotaxis protein
VIAVDDHQAIRAYVATWVEKTGIAAVVDVCGDARSALAACHELLPDMVLCDMHMPYVDGLGFIELLERAGLEIPVLLFSAHAVDSFTDRAVLQKTATLQELHAAILLCVNGTSV